MKKFFDYIFSMTFGGTMLLLFAAVIGTATFIENDYGTTAAKLLIYNSVWFELLLIITAISLTGSIFKYKLLAKKKYSALLFHLAFIVMLFGAGITRYFGMEGNMRIREGESSNKIITSNTYVQLQVKDQGKEYHFDKQYLFSSFKKNKFEETVKFGEKQARLRFVEYIPNAAETIEEVPGGNPVISFITMDAAGTKNTFIQPGERFESDSLIFNFHSKEAEEDAIQLFFIEDEFHFNAPFDVTLISMRDQTTDTLPGHKLHPIQLMKLYNMNGNQVVFRGLYKSAITKLVSAAPDANMHPANAVIFEVEYNNTRDQLTVIGGQGVLGEASVAAIDGVEFFVKYGSRIIEIPFSLYLRDFQLERYPGSMSPSSFVSEITVIDPRTDEDIPYRIFMNNVLNYRGYRFFQSSYDQDEKGTILSVNEDYWGTMVTYIGYFFLTAGMFFNFFSKRSRFQMLARSSSKIGNKAKKASLVILLFMLSGTPAMLNAQQMDHSGFTNQLAIDPGHAAQFGKLLVQDRDGRIKPMNSLTSEILRKVYRKEKYLGLNSDQVFLGMLSNQVFWQAVPFIKVSDDEVKSLLGISGKYASFNDFIERSHSQYKLSGYVDQAYAKKPSERNRFDKDIIKVDERVNITYMVYTGELLTIFPKPGDPDNKWYASTNTGMAFDSVDAGFVDNVLGLYYASVNEAMQSGNWEKADEYLGYISIFQEKYGSSIMPEISKTNLEIRYNKVQLFKRLFPVYWLAGFVLLILLFTSVLVPRFKFSMVSRIIIILIGIAFILHTLGLAARWYISGHAPWSDGYETMIYISWAVVLSGFIFSRRSRIVLAVTAILASLTLMVANMSWLDPEITNLVPVLKSYWLVIHVAVITASYSFLAIGALLGFLNIILINFQTKKNYLKLNETIRELTSINEMNLIIGVFLVTVGTFLGAVWANESWGRYWSWDPKETWALVTILVYSFIVHMRMIPGLNGLFAFNFAALIGFSSVLMTYFGVNYYLSGMHSYAQGDPVPVPTFVYYAIAIIAIVSIVGYLNYVKIKKVLSRS